MTTLTEFMIIAGADNHPPMLDKSMYKSWKSRMELYIENMENERMIFNSVLNGPLVWPTGIPPDVYIIVNHHKVSKDIWDRVKLLMQSTKLSLQEREYLGIPNGEAAQTTIPNNVAFQVKDLDAYDSDCDDVSTAQAVLMANLSNYGSDVISESNNALKFIRKNFFDNDRLLHQIISHEVMLIVMNSTTVDGDSVNVEMQTSESYDKCFDLDVELLKKQNAYNALLKRYSQLEKHCIYLELSMQLNQEIFQKDKSYDNQNALKIPKYFKNNDLKAQLQAKDTIIHKLKDHIKYMRENNKDEKVKLDMDEIETINIELEHSVAKLLSENELLHKEIEHLKRIYKDNFDSIKRTHACFKELIDSLIAQLDSTSMENADLKG
nr:hypothetical protein [Tanacetum cinerariifolium]